MAAILPSLSIDAPDEKLSRYFLPYQIRWIHDPSRMRLAEKSVRIGGTFADALKNVRQRIIHKKRDYLFATPRLTGLSGYIPKNPAIQKHRL